MVKRFSAKIKPKAMISSARKVIREMARDSIPGSRRIASVWNGKVEKTRLRKEQQVFSSWRARTLFPTTRNRSSIANPEVRRRVDAMSADYSPNGIQRLERYNDRKSRQAQAFHEQLFSLKTRKRANSQPIRRKRMRPSRSR